MGIEYNFKCPDCNYNIFISLGLGFLFPMVYNKIVDEAKQGKYGKEIKDFLITFPEGKIDTENILVVCQECGNIEVLPDLSMYIPKKCMIKQDKKLRWSVEFSFTGVQYVTHKDLVNDYELFEEYHHKCSKCKGNMSLITRNEILPKGILKCPKCKNLLSLIDFGFSD